MEPSIQNSNKKDKTSTLTKLEDWHSEELNEFALSVTKYYKNQTPYTSKDPFTDPLFPPNENSLLGTKDLKGNLLGDVIKRKGQKETLKSDIPNVNDIVWLRASEIFRERKFAVFETSIVPSDVNQGSIGNCYFLSSLASMSKYPQLIMQIFRTPFTTENGCYEICMRINGVWKVVMVDDYFPCNKETRKPIFSRPSGNEMWVMLLEKAWAKLNGGYNHTSGGRNCEVWECLTNFPCYEYFLDGDNDDFLYNFLKEARPVNQQKIKRETDLCTDLKKKFWAKILQCVREKVIMYASSKKEENGILDSHAYTLLDAKERKVNGETIRLVKLRNPWGQGEWEGDWSDKSAKWTEEAKEAFEHKELKDDGCFYMPFASFLEHFHSIGLCKNLDPICSRTKTLPKQIDGYKCFVFDFTLPKKSKVNVSVFKKSSRFNKKIDLQASCNLILIIAKKDGTASYRKEFVEVYDKNLHLATELEAGSYVVFTSCMYDRTYFSMDNFNPFDKFRKLTVDVAADNFFDLTYIGIDSTKAAIGLEQKDKISDMFYKKKYLFTPVKAKEPTNSGYNFVGRNLKFIENPYIVKIDPFKQAVRYYTKKYPKEMSYLNKLETMSKRYLNVGSELTSFVHKSLPGNVFYLGVSFIRYFAMYGPGILVYSDEGYCYGDFTDNIKDGLFFYVDKGKIMRFNFKKGKVEGEAYYIETDGGSFEILHPIKYEVGEDGKIAIKKNEYDLPEYLWNENFYTDVESQLGELETDELPEIEKIDLNDEEEQEIME